MAIALDGPAVARIERVLEHDRGRMPLPEALTRRLGVESWMLTLDPSGRLRAITVLGSAIAPPAGDDAPAPAIATEGPLERRYPLRRLGRWRGSSVVPPARVASSPTWRSAATIPRSVPKPSGSPSMP
jgi:hypothetical protein